MIYSLEFIKSIHDEVIKNHKLDVSVELMITILSDKVLSPNYSKTPIFNKKRNNNNGMFNYGKFIQKESTKIIDDKNVLNDVKCLINKLSKETKKEISVKILKHINTCEEKQIKDIVNLLFNVKSSSLKYIQTLSETIQQILDNKNSLIVYVNETINDITQNIVNIIVDESNYDNFCKHNELMENKTCQYILLSILTKNNVLEHFHIERLLELLYTTILNNIKNEDYRILNDYYIKNICKILTILCDFDNLTNLVEKHNNNIRSLLKLCNDKNENKGLTKKCSFNIMDYYDENGLEY